MMFRNLTLYSLPSDWAMSVTELDAVLAGHPLLPCNAASMQSTGWLAASNDGSLVYSRERSMLLCLGYERRLLPAAVVNQAAAEKAKLIEKSQGFPIGRKQLRDLKEQVVEELRPRSFVKRSSLKAWISPEDRWFCVGTGSSRQAEDFASVLRSDLGQFPIAPLDLSTSAAARMAGWLIRQELPNGFALGSHAELCGISSEKPTVRYLRHDLDGADLRQHLLDGKGVQRLHLIWRDRIEFVVTDSLQLKSIRYLSMSDLPADAGTAGDTEEDRAAADFSLMSGEFRSLLSDLIVAFGACHPD